MWKLEFWKLEIKFGNWKIGISGNWELNLEIGILKNYLKMKILKIHKWINK